MANVATQQTTADMFSDMPLGPPYYQLIGGQLFMSPSPVTNHQHCAFNLTGLLFAYLRERPNERGFVAPIDVYLDELNVFVPDLCVVRQERLHLISARGIEGAPDLVIEILSPRTARFDTGAKKATYAAAGTTELWLVDPKTRTIQIFDLQENATKPRATVGGNESIPSSVLAGFSCSADEVFKNCI